MLGFQKATSANLKIEKLFLTLATSNCQKLFVIEFDSKSSWLKKKNKKQLVSEGIYDKKTRGGGDKIAFFRV